LFKGSGSVCLRAPGFFFEKGGSMQVSKPFRTYKEQIAILKDRGMCFASVKEEQQAIQVLERENYYNVINGYKDIFLQKKQKSIDDTVIKPEKFKKGTTFTAISSLYFFDRELRNLCLKYMLKIESSLKSTISYRFSEMYSDQLNPYFDLNNYGIEGNSKNILTITKNIAILSSAISHKSKENPIKHYLEAFGTVPLWVLVDVMTLGNINYFYGCLKNDLKNKIAFDFSHYFNDNGKKLNNQDIHLQSTDIEGILKIINNFRNVCAHEEILYRHFLRKTPRVSTIANYLNIDFSVSQPSNLFLLLTMMRFYLSDEECNEILKSLEAIFTKYNTKISTATVRFEKVLEIMGFNKNEPQLFEEVLHY